MSTTPGHDAMRDAGLTHPSPDGSVNLTEEALRGTDVPGPRDAEDYDPGTPRPDRSGAADEADVAEQAWEVPEDDEPV
ncbi:hypothetical protein [Sanguibacter suaedae]|uniref:DUF5709 domain-containing protein n=1 Tax=Sanguibacter suaedae TaxID=2795737 RepID=A0A934I6J1_9MICO|nr:hypothetical protein [Sanguibacter suaedae]MBI9115156.1 hypothetical protein [Sanguibacter suaedae]